MRPAPITRLLSRLDAQDGFTMVELMVAVSILVIGIVGTFVGFESSQRLSLVSERHATTATWLSARSSAWRGSRTARSG